MLPHFFIKPPLCKGRWHGAQRRDGGIVFSGDNNPSVSSADSPLYTREPYSYYNLSAGSNR